LLVVDLVDFRALNAKFGTVAGDHVLVVLAQTLRKTFRGSDTICRVGGDEFLVIMPETSESQARAPISRLHRNLEQWNATTALDYKLAVRYGAREYTGAADICSVLESASEVAGANIGSMIARMRSFASEHQKSAHRPSVLALESERRDAPQVLGNLQFSQK
jgi:GGDEF domain-containing protein